MTNFEKWNTLFNKQDLYAFNGNKNGILWLKVRAICRSRQLNKFLGLNKLRLSSSKIHEQAKELFSTLEGRSSSTQLLDIFLKDFDNEWHKLEGIDEEKLKEDLYKVRYYTWGGDQNNSLDKYLIKQYVKIISSYEDLQNKKAEIAENSWHYVLNSWYNNWTSYLIESLFKRNKNVISAVGAIKSVDFFIKDYPIDLKITFFPSQFMQEKLKSRLGKSELSWLKNKAKDFGIHCGNTQSNQQQLYTLHEQLSDMGKIEILSELNTIKKAIVSEAQCAPVELMTWLYSNQGEMRFGAENRLFLILVDTNNYEQSWKMKRAFGIIEPIVTSYLNGFKSNKLTCINFSYKEHSYKALADALFVIK